MMKRPLIFAHRGARAAAPENTLPAFERAVEMGADGIEFDVLLSADGVPVVIHDEVVDTTTDGSGKVSEMALDALRRLDAGSHFDAAFAGTRIPTLAEVLDAMPRDFWLNIELKGTQTEALPAAVRYVIERVGRREPMVISSFNPQMLRAAQGLMPDIPRGFLTVPEADYLGWESTFVQWWHPHTTSVTAENISEAQQKGQRVNVWTTPVEEAERMTRLGVDGIITDYPDKVLDRFNGLFS